MGANAHPLRAKRAAAMNTEQKGERYER